MTNDFETHPVGTARRLAELEGLAFARRRTEYACPVTDEDADAARRAFHADGCSPWGDASPSIRVRWRRVAEAMRDRLPGREMVAVAQPDTCPDTEDLPGALRGQPIDPADALDPRTVPAEPEDPRVAVVIQWWRGSIEPMATDKDAARDLLARLDPDAAHSAMRPIDPADVRKGDRVRIITEGTVKEIDACGWVMEPHAFVESWCLLDRPSALHAAIADALSGVLDDNGETTCDWSAEAPAVVAALRAAGFVIEPAPKEADRA